MLEFDLSSISRDPVEIRHAQLGRSSQQAIVTADDHRNVSLWRISKATAVLTFQGHSSDITAVTFSHQEDFVYSGSFGGTVLVWDLNQQKAAYSLNSHRAACTALAPFPRSTQTLLASGSSDCTLKLWDLRKKHCVQTFKGHEGKITSLAFSPDCRWVASGSDDGYIKIWDCAGAKKLCDLAAPSTGVTVLKFNPTNMSLAAGYTDRVVRYWNLETQTLETTTAAENSPIQQVCFEPTSGSLLFAAVPNALKLWQIEQGFLCDSVETDWRNVGDLEVSKENEVLIGLSYGSGTFAVYTTDLNALRMELPKTEEMKVDPAEFRRKEPVRAKKTDIPEPTTPPLLPAIGEMQEEHRPLLVLLEQRSRILKELAATWASGRLVEALETAEGLKDHSILTSMLEEGILSGSAVVSLEHCAGIVRLSESLIASKYESFIKVGLRTVSYMLRKFFDVVTSMLSMAPGQGVDLSREDRMQRCERCYTAFLQVKTNQALEKTCKRTNDTGELARGLVEDLNRFLWRCGRR